MPKALVVYTSRTGETKAIADLIAEGMRFGGVIVSVTDAGEIKDVAQLDGYEAVILGSPTYHGEMLQPMKTILFLMEKANLKGKIGGAFGAFGWSGEAPERIYNTMKNIFKMTMVKGPLLLKSASLGGGMQMAHDYGRDITKKIEVV